MNKLKIILVSLIFLIIAVSGIMIYLKINSQTGIVVYEKPTLKVAGHTTMLGIVLEIAKEQGYYEQEGVKVDLQQVESSSVSMPALANGDLDIVIGSISAGSFNHLIKNKDLRIIADGARVVPIIVVRKDLANEIMSIEDFKGKIILTPREGSASYYALAKILDTKGLSINDIEPKYLREEESIASFETKQIEAGIVNEPYATYLSERGLVIKFDSAKINPIFPKNGQQHMILFATTRTLQNEDAVERFLRAYKKAAEYYNRALEGKEPERSKVIEIASKVYGNEPEIIEKSQWPTISIDVIPDVLYLNEAQEYYLANGLIDENVNLNEKVDLRFLG
ncbi:MAG: ABC transporter substrate-binding protein [Candidatus Woesearchaeota archaeon]